MPSLQDHIIGNADKIRDPKVDTLLDEYEEIPQEANIASRMLENTYIKLGRPQDPFTEAGSKMMEVIISVWLDLYPKEATLWMEERNNHVASEMDIKEQVHRKTGRSLASFPWPVYQMMKTLFPKFKPQDRNVCIKLVRKWPIFKMVNKV